MEALSQEARKLAFQTQRSRIVKYLVFFLIMDSIWIVLLVAFLLGVSGGPFVRPSPDPSLIIVIQIFLLILSIPTCFLVIWLSFFALFTMRRLVSRRPALLVTSSGIDCQDLLATGNTFLSWGEVASLSIVSIQQTPSKSLSYLCFDPKDHAQFLLRFHLLRRIFVRLDSCATGTLIHVPHWYLSKPVREILLQIQETFPVELQTYEVQVLDADSNTNISTKTA